MSNVKRLQGFMPNTEWFLEYLGGQAGPLLTELQSAHPKATEVIQLTVLMLFRGMVRRGRAERAFVWEKGATDGFRAGRSPDTYLERPPGFWHASEQSAGRLLEDTSETGEKNKVHLKVRFQPVWDTGVGVPGTDNIWSWRHESGPG